MSAERRAMWTVLRPTVVPEPELARFFADCATALAATADSGCVPAVRGRFLRRAEQLAGNRLHELRVLVGVLCDLRAMGWSYLIRDREVFIRAPSISELDPAALKKFVREGHLVERDAQLEQPSTRAFVESMERKRLGPTGWHSVFSLIRDGQALAEDLEVVRASLKGADRVKRLSEIVRPYVQVARRGETCRFTGLDLSQVWRYFRHTWTTVYQSTPGRSLPFLIRDAAAPNHPVIGIGGLGSSIVQLRARDAWIGWSAEEFLNRVREDPSKWARWVTRELDALVGEVYWVDFADAGLLDEDLLAAPDAASIARLRSAAQEARETHRLFPQHNEHKDSNVDPDWEVRARTHLFRSKRARALAELLQIRLDLAAVGFRRATVRNLNRALDDPRGQHALQSILRRVKARHVGVKIMDITVCGALAPYNALLGGKLVSLLMTSSEVIRAYVDQYRDASSVIASSMAGRAIRREPDLVLLGTTSLYGTAPSQYNRVRMPADVAGGREGEEIRFVRVGETIGYGSYHFSAETIARMEVLLARSNRGREVNSIFGEGVNPKLRKVRAALEEIGLPAELLLQHGQPRAVYAIPLAANFRDILLGHTRRARYLLPLRKRTDTAIGRYWIERWVNRRIDVPGILEEVAGHSVTYPVTHGARVPTARGLP